MTTAQVWIDSTRDMLLSSYVEELDVLTAAITDTTVQTLQIQGTSSSIAKGVVFEVGTEMFYCTSVALDGITQFVKFLQNTPKIVMCFGIVWFY